MMPSELPERWRARIVKPTTPTVATFPTTPKPCTTGGTPYGRKALADELERVRTAPEGDRNNQTNKSALATASLCAGGEIPDVRDDLIAAAVAAGLPETETRKTVESGWRAGLAQPRTAPPKAGPMPPTCKTAPASTVAPGQTSAAASETAAEPETITLSTVKPRRDTYIWGGRVTAGGTTVDTGQPGIGKGLLNAYVAAHFTTQRAMFGDLAAQPAGDVLWIATEDRPETRLVPRLIAAGADLSRIHAWNMCRPVSLPEDCQRIVDRIDFHGARLVIIDPAQTVITRDYSANSDADVRRTFAPLMAACAARHCALILVRHTNKRTLGSAMDRGGGSIAWSGMADIELMMGRRPVEEGATATDAHESVITLATVKNNTGRWAPSINFAIVEAEQSARLEPLGETASTADDLCGQDRPRIAHRTSEAEALLRRILADGEWHRETEIEAEAAKGEISIATLRRAKKALRVEATKRGVNWFWSLKVITTPHPEHDEHLEHDEMREHLHSNNNNYLEGQDDQGDHDTQSPPHDHLDAAESTPRRAKKVSV